MLIPQISPCRNDKNVRCQRQLAGVQTAGAKSEGNCHLLPKGPGASGGQQGRQGQRATCSRARFQKVLSGEEGSLSLSQWLQAEKPLCRAS